MTAWTCLTLGVAPGLFWLVYFWRRDRIEPEPGRLVVRTYVAGVAVAGLAIVVELLLDRLPTSALAQVALLAPVVEELLKYLAVRRTVYELAEFDEPLDGLIYAAAAALGFASVENVVYLAQTWQTGLLPAVFVTRAVLAVPGHAVWSGLWGYALGRARFVEGPIGRRLVWRGLLAAMLLHGVYNYVVYVVLGFSWLAWLLLPVLALGWWLTARHLSEGLRRSPHRPAAQASETGTTRPS